MKMIWAWFIWENVLLRGALQIDAINSNFESFESALYMKSVSMPLSIGFVWYISRLLILFETYYGYIEANCLRNSKLALKFH